MDVKLIVVGGNASRRSVVLTPPAVIGRSREVALTVGHPMVSRRHCEIFEVGGQVMIRDLGSLNGTLVGGRPVSEAPLQPDDELMIGPLTFRVIYDYEARSEGSPQPEILVAGPGEPSRSDMQPSAAAEAETEDFVATRTLAPRSAAVAPEYPEDNDQSCQAPGS